MNYLSEQEKQELKNFIANPVVLNAIRKVLLAGVYYNGTLEPDKDPEPNMNFAIQAANYAIQNDPKVTNEQLGEGLRANCAAVRLIELGFQELMKLKKEI